MRRFFSLAFLLMFVLLAACGTLEVSVEQTPTANLAATATLGILTTQNAALSTRVATLDPVSQPLGLDSDSETIRLKMLRSHTYWRSIFVDASVYWGGAADSGQVVQSVHEQLWVHQVVPAFRRLNGPLGGAPDNFLVSDGQIILEMDLKTGVSRTFELPQFVKEPYDPPIVISDTVYPHPLAGTIGSPVDDLIFPSGLAQREGAFRTVALEQVAGRLCLVVDWYRENDQRPSRYWLDVETAVILRAQGFGKGGGQAIQDETIVNQVAYDLLFEPSLFSTTLTTVPTWGDEMGAALTASPTPGPTAEGEDPLGQVYFFIIDNGYPDPVIQLVRLPGSCVTGAAACPALERVATPFALKFSLSPLVWSRDGSLAAFAYPINEEGSRSALFTFDPQTDTWNQLAVYNYVDMPLWSPDGRWIAFRQQDGQGGEDIYAIHPDGTGLVNLSAAEGLPADAGPYVMDGWTSNYVILRSGLPGREGTVYMVRAEDGLVRPMFEAELTKASFIPSPDGSLLAYDEYDDNTLVHTLRVIAPDGSGLRDLATFVNVSIQSLVWSPDINYLAFSVVRDVNQPTSDVYVIRRDGRELAQVYHGLGVASLTFSPDGRSLLIADMDATGDHLYVVSLVTYATRLLQAPDLPLNWRWLQPSWRP